MKIFTGSILIIFFLLVSCKNLSKKNKIADNNSSKISDCSVERTPEFKTKHEIKNEVLKLVAKKDFIKLNQIAACEFMLGAPNSDLAVFGNPKNIMKNLLNSIKDINWPVEGSDYKTQYNLIAEENHLTYELIFKINKNKKWYWAGFATSDEALLHELAKAGDFKNIDQPE